MVSGIRLWVVVVLLTVALGIFGTAVSQEKGRSYFGEVHGRKFFVTAAEANFDTLGRELLETQSDGSNLPAYRTIGLSAISGAILLNKGYELIALTQWRSVSRTELSGPVKGKMDRGSRMVFITDLLWEKIVDSKIQKAPKGFQVRFEFDKAGANDFEGKEAVRNKGKKLLGENSQLAIKIRHSGVSLQGVDRQIFRILVIGEEGDKAKKLVRVVEDGMGELGLDLSYKVPRFKKQ